jgi:hypothetical protein
LNSSREKMENRFFRWRGVDASPTRIVPTDLLPQLPLTDARYFVRIMEQLDRLLPAAGLTFFLTWHLDDFHEAMENAVIIMPCDEQHQTPAFGGRVKAIFKTGGIRREPLRETLQLPASIAWRMLLRDARNAAVGVKRSWRLELPGRAAAPTFEIPYGTFALVDFDPPPVEQRPVDVFFAGEAPSGWTLRAKFIARRQMAAAAAAARLALPNCRMQSSVAGVVSNKALGPAAYTRALANAKIALAPRGNCDGESYRIFEAAKLGCIVVSELQPARWYFRDCPAVMLRRWSELPNVLRDLLNDPARMVELSHRARQWYEQKISELSVAKFIAEALSGFRAVRAGEESAARPQNQAATDYTHTKPA